MSCMYERNWPLSACSILKPVLEFQSYNIVATQSVILFDMCMINIFKHWYVLLSLGQKQCWFSFCVKCFEVSFKVTSYCIKLTW